MIPFQQLNLLNLPSKSFPTTDATVFAPTLISIEELLRKKIVGVLLQLYFETKTTRSGQL